jgi:hypothetical protein
MEHLYVKAPTREETRLLQSRGVSGGDIFHERHKIDFLDNLVKFETSLPGVMPKPIAVARQIKAIEKIFKHPLSNYTVGIASFPTDVRAKQLAVQIMIHAMAAWKKSHRPGKALPLWHRVMGGLGDSLRDKKVQEENPSMLIISNVNEASSNYKLEKVRDLLELFDCPKILVLGSSDPVTFFGTKLYYPINAGILIGSTDRIKED